MKPWRTADGRIGGALVFTEVITEQVEGRRALAESEARFRAMFENAAVGIALVAPDGRWLRVNEALCRILGYPVDELIKKSFQDVTHPDDLAADVENFNRVIAGEMDGYTLDKRWICKEGRVIHSIMAAKCLRRVDGSVDYFVGLVLDTTARKPPAACRRSG